MARPSADSRRSSAPGFAGLLQEREDGEQMSLEDHQVTHLLPSSCSCRGRRQRTTDTRICGIGEICGPTFYWPRTAEIGSTPSARLAGITDASSAATASAP